MIFEIFCQSSITSWHACVSVKLQDSRSSGIVLASPSSLVLSLWLWWRQQMEALQVGESEASVPGDAGEIKLQSMMMINVYMPTPPQLNRLTGWDAFDFMLTGIMYRKIMPSYWVILQDLSHSARTDHSQPQNPSKNTAHKQYLRFRWNYSMYTEV